MPGITGLEILPRPRRYDRRPGNHDLTAYGDAENKRKALEMALKAL